ncbi:MAG: hypothetical protein JWO74_4490 [Solirubrobacterales bacterium]|jgi:hypothetical protein|nr:hypothetical protein [Solirubrobacterales bacterium]
MWRRAAVASCLAADGTPGGASRGWVYAARRRA